MPGHDNPFQTNVAPENNSHSSVPPPLSPQKARQLNTFIRFVLVFFVAVVLLVPLMLLQSMVSERSYLQMDAVSEIQTAWGGTQLIGGPFLVVPYTVKQESVEYVERKGKQEKVTKEYNVTYNRIVLPKNIAFTAEMIPEERYLGIYSTTVFSAPIRIEGEFDFLTYSNLVKIHWDQAKLICGIPDIRASRSPALIWNNNEKTLYSGTDLLSSIPGMRSGFNAPVDMSDKVKQYPFLLSLKLMGSGSLGFTPVGETTTVKMSSTWPSPNFVSQMLPDERKVGPEGFTATCNVSSLNRSYPQTADIEQWPDGWDSFVIATSFTEPVSLYHAITRAVKYGILFIGVTFIVFLTFELVSKRRLHYVQYGLIGLAMVLFFLTLLSLAEHVRFIYAYAAASLVVVGMISSYVGAALRSLRHGFIMAALMTVLYITLYVLLQLEDYAMLMGTTIILLMLAVLMYVTRSVNSEE